MPMMGPHDLAPDHGRHDETLVAALVARPQDLEPDAQAGGRAQVDACPACASLLADLQALAVALPSTRTSLRDRDFTLDPGEAARLRPRGWRAILRGLGTARDSVTRPLAVGLTTFGLVGMLVASVPGALVGGAATGSALSPVGDAPASLRTMESQGEAAPGAGEDAGGEVFNGTDGGAMPQASDGDGDIAAEAPGVDELAVRDDPSGWSVLFVLAGVMTLAGLSLLALRWSARRL